MSNFFSNLIVSFFSGILGAGVSILFNRKLYRLQVKDLEKKLNDKEDRLEFVEYQISNETGKIIYDGSNRNIEADFDGGPYYAWSDEKKGFLDVMGQGSHKIENGIIDINRTNTGGRYSLGLRRYNYGNILPRIPIDKTINGKRKLKLTCEAKSIGAEHTLGFIFKANEDRDTLDYREYKVFNNTWESVELAFSIDTDKESYLRIDDRDVSTAPSSVQIRNLILYEKM